MTYKLIKKLNNGVRLGRLETPHGEIETPFFMPVGTVGSVKSQSSEELEKLGAQVILSNTYHLYLRPGERLIKEMGGLHSFMRWNKPILTDSGGYQVFSLGENKVKGEKSKSKIKENSHSNLTKSLVKISEEGVTFKSHLDGSSHLFTPEKVIDIQLDLVVDILMPLDVCPSGKASEKEVREAVDITIRWAQRAKAHFGSRTKDYESGKKPSLHGIVQGGMDPNFRKYCAEELMKLDFDGYSVGGLAVDLETRDMWETVKQMGEILPEDKQRYLMGVGTPDDIVKATMLGMDMFDCVLPTRLARHGNVYIKRRSSKLEALNKYELVNLFNSIYQTDMGVIDEKCGCQACQRGDGYSKAYIAHLLRSNEILGLRLTTNHNLWQYLQLMREIRKV